MATRHPSFGRFPLAQAGWVSLILFLGLALVVPTRALAADPGPAPKLRVLALHVDGAKLALLDREELFGAIRSKLELYPTIALTDAPAGEITDEMIELECIDLDAECLSKLGQKYKVDRVIHTEVTHKPRGPELKLRVVDVQLGKLVHDKLLEAKTAKALAPLLEAELEVPFGPPPKIVRKGTLVVETSPKASIYLGAELVGTGRASVELEPGPYTIRVTEPGFQETIREVKIESSLTTTEKVALVAIPKPPKDPPVDAPPKVSAKSNSNWIIWAVVAGAVVIGGTVTAIALSGDSGEDILRGPALLGIDGSSAWRDPATFGGRQ